MDRRKSLQTMILGAGATALVFHSCKSEGDATTNAIPKSDPKYFGRTPEELERLDKINAEQLFNAHEVYRIYWQRYARPSANLIRRFNVA